jgi:hypothetical protein
MRDRLLAGLQPFYLPVLLKWLTAMVLEAVLKKYVYIRNRGIAKDIQAPLHGLFCRLSLIHDNLRTHYSNAYSFINLFKTYLNAIINEI